MGTEARVRDFYVLHIVWNVMFVCIASNCLIHIFIPPSFCFFIHTFSHSLTEDKTPGSLGFEKVKLIPDGNAQFTRGMGMSTIWDSERGFGERSWRYSAVINDMKLEKLFIEGGGITQNSGPDPFEVSDVDTMMDYLKSVANSEL